MSGNYLLELARVLRPGTPDHLLPTIMALGVYCDESESHNPRVFTLAGWASVPTAWGQFSLAWREMLKCSGPTEIRAFHTVDLAALRPRAGECKSWKRADRRSLIRRATDILLDKDIMAIPFAVGASIEVDVFKQYWPSWNPTTEELYQWAFLSLMYQVATHGVEQDIVFVMDTKTSVEVNVTKAFYEAKAFLVKADAGDKLGGIAFEDDRVVIQLQAADYLAYVIRRGIVAKRTGVKQRRERDEYHRLKGRPHFLRCYGQKFLENLAAHQPPISAGTSTYDLFVAAITVGAPED